MTLESGTPGSVNGLARSGAALGPHVTVADTILLLLEDRPGQPLCGSCIAKALALSPKRVYSALSITEGRGGRRYHGSCSGCGNRRLVAMRTTGGVRTT